jgi:hypothetical protein
MNRTPRPAAPALLLAACFAAFGCSVATTARGATEEFTVVIQGVTSGTMRVTTEGDRVAVAYRYLDNGRGPELEESFRVDTLQRPVEYRVRGKSTFGGEVREDFAIDGGRWRWDSVADRGDEAAPAGGVFVPLESTPAHWGQLLRALLANADSSAPTIQGARLRAERLGQLEVGGGGGPVKVQLYVVNGADAWPWYLWLREDDARFFAVGWPGWAVTPSGYEGVVDALMHFQQQAQAARLETLQRRVAQPLPGLTLIRGVHWFDSPAAVRRGPSDIYLADGRIAAVTPPGVLQAQPRQVIDGAGATLLPGLFDMHAHLWPEAGTMYLAAGVTTVRDMANQNADLMQLKARIDGGQVPGPHVVPAGFIEGKSPFSARNGFVVDSIDAGVQAVDWYFARGYRQIKLYNSIKPEWVKPLAERAHAHGMTVAGHVPAFMRAEEAVNDGYDELTHINQVMLNFFVRPDQDTRTLLRFELVAERGRGVDPQGAAEQRFIELLRRKGTVVDPTLTAFEAQFTQRDGEPNPSLVAVAEHLPVLVRRGMAKSPASPSAQLAGVWRESYASMARFVAALHRAGVTLVAGTDEDLPGLAMFRELELYVRAGIPAAEVLRIATWNGAKVAGVADRSGSIERGKAADLALVEGDPTRDITDLRRTKLVIKGALAYAPAALYEAVGIKAFAPAAAIEVIGPVTAERTSAKP